MDFYLLSPRSSEQTHCLPDGMHLSFEKDVDSRLDSLWGKKKVLMKNLNQISAENTSHKDIESFFFLILLLFMSCVVVVCCCCF